MKPTHRLLGAALVAGILAAVPTPGCSAPDRTVYKVQGKRVSRDAWEIRQRIDEWIGALKRNDSEVRAGIMADGFTISTYDGALYTKEQILKFAESGDYRLEDVVINDIAIRVYGHTGVVNALVTLTERIGARTVTNKVRVTQAWVKSRGRWRAVAEQATLVPS